jgi:hypothetical protein
MVSAVVVAMGLVVAGATGAVAAPVGADLLGAVGTRSLLEHVQFSGGRYCAQLRRACEFKHERGEAGEGNCRRYRAECGGERISYCERLRRACVFKDERGQTGQGNCRRYRAECGGDRY